MSERFYHGATSRSPTINKCKTEDLYFKEGKKKKKKKKKRPKRRVFYNVERRKEGRKEGNVLFNDALNTFYLRLYDISHMVKDHSDSERGNPLPPHGLLFPISSKGSFICT